MKHVAEPWLTIRTGESGDIPALQQIYRAAALSNAGDAPMLLARSEFLVFTGEGVTSGRTLVAVAGQPGAGAVVGFATIALGHGGDAELEDLFVDPDWRRRGIARHLVRQIVAVAHDAELPRLWVTGNPHAMAFYSAVGFLKTGEVSTELGTGVRLVLDTSGP
jgi:N-acetylglutamate synthase-like GNAT family acetyltransferase